MSFLGRKKREIQLRSLRAKAESAPTAPTPTLSTDPSPHQPSQQITANPPEAQPLPESQSSAAEPSYSGQPIGEVLSEDTGAGPEDMLDAAFIGRIIKLVRADNWDEDI